MSNEPLLEYVWEVANHFLPDYEDVSAAPAIFANRYAERNLSVEERYERSIEMKTFNGTLEEYKKRKYRKLDDSFKKTFLDNKNLQNTIEAFGFDVSKFWYLLLFIRDFIEDIGTNSPTVGKPLLEDFASFLTNLCTASSIVLKQGSKNVYSTEREDLLDIIQKAVFHFSDTYSKIVNGKQNRETKIKQLQELGLKGFIDNSLLSQINFNGKYKLDDSHKRWKFAEMFLYFLEGKKADKKGYVTEVQGFPLKRTYSFQDCSTPLVMFQKHITRNFKIRSPTDCCPNSSENIARRNFHLS